MKEAENKQQAIVSSDSVSRQAAIDAVNDVLSHYIPLFRNDQEGIPLECARAIMNLPSADLSSYSDKLYQKAYERGKAEWQEEHKEPCWACESLENGDTLYSMSDWDGGIGFDYIRDIEYCPLCGRKL